MLNSEQVAQLLKPIKPSRVLQANGQSHVPAYDVAAHLTRILGFGGWETDLLGTTLLFETSERRQRKTQNGVVEYEVWTVGYSATVRLTVKDPTGAVVAHWENGAAGDAVNQPSRADAHHLALTTAISTAMKRCAAFGLGDQFGLSLYNKGSLKPLLGLTLVGPLEASAAVDPESHVEKPQSLGNDERQAGPGAPEMDEPDADTGESVAALSGQSGGQSEKTDPESLLAQVRAHPNYKAMSVAEKADFVSDQAGHPVATLRDLTDEECEAVLAGLDRR